MLVPQGDSPRTGAASRSPFCENPASTSAACRRQLALRTSDDCGVARGLAQLWEDSGGWSTVRNPEVEGLISSQGLCSGCKADPWSGAYGRQPIGFLHIDVSLSAPHPKENQFMYPLKRKRKRKRKSEVAVARFQVSPELGAGAAPAPAQASSPLKGLESSCSAPRLVMATWTPARVGTPRSEYITCATRPAAASQSSQNHLN